MNIQNKNKMKQRRQPIHMQSPGTLINRKNQHFRIRSSSRQKFLSTLQKSKQKYMIDTQEVDKKQRFKLKTSNKQLRKIIIKSHQRQKSQHLEKNNCLFTQVNSNKLDQSKALYQSVKTQQVQTDRKKWIDINSIDTSEDIKVLDRITNFFDPVRIMNQCYLKSKIENKSVEQRSKSNSIKKSKLAQKINTLIFDMSLKQRNKHPFKLHHKKFQVFTNSEQKQQRKQNKSNAKSPQKQVNQPITSKPQQISILSNLKQTFSSQLISPQKKPDEKRKLKKIKMPSTKLVMDKYWQQVNESLILAAHQEYASKDLRELVYHNMH